MVGGTQQAAEVLTFPPNSSDLNPREHLRDVQKKSLIHRGPTWQTLGLKGHATNNLVPNTFSVLGR